MRKNRSDQIPRPDARAALQHERVHAVDLSFDEAGAYAGFDEESPLARLTAPVPGGPRNSPAWIQGLRPGDLIYGLNRAITVTAVPAPGVSSGQAIQQLKAAGDAVGGGAVQEDV